ncbi:hypothetical protein JCM10449v2_003241 [Rhodotorula kratochvilovae]
MPSSAQRALLLPVLLLLELLAHCVHGYQVLVSDQDEVRQVCSGMWGSGGKQAPFIEVLFSPASRGQLALVIFEWEDAQWLGVSADGKGGANDWSKDRAYICTVEAQQAGLCDAQQLGLFLTAPGAPSESSIFTSSVRFDAVPSAPAARGPYRYKVPRTGYYCVGVVPVMLEGASRNASFTGVVDFENTFGGHLPAAEYPKVAFYRVLFLVYLVFAIFWASICWAYRRDLLPLQRYISATVLFLVVEQLFVWLYWRFMNTSGHPGVAGAYLFLVSALNAARNSVSLYLLTLASMGLSVVRPSLGGVMAKVRLLALFHFTFSLLYSVGTVTVPLESAGFFVVFFALPLAISLTAFLMWVLYSLNSTIADLNARRQSYKRTMFVRLYCILVVASSLILVLFIASSITFSSRLSPSFPARTWQTRWLLLDGWLSLLFAGVFFAVAYLWRPTGANRRLALSDELPHDEGDVDLEEELLADEDRDDAGELDGSSIVLRQRRSTDSRVVFDVGSDEDDDDASDAASEPRDTKRRFFPRRSGDGAGLLDGGEDERAADEEDRDITSQHAQRGAGDAPPAYERRGRDESFKEI